MIASRSFRLLTEPRHRLQLYSLTLWHPRAASTSTSAQAGHSGGARSIGGAGGCIDARARAGGERDLRGTEAPSRLGLRGRWPGTRARAPWGNSSVGAGDDAFASNSVMEGGAGAGSWQLPARPLLMDAFRVGQGPDQLHALPGRPLLWDGGRASVEWASSSASPASRPSVHSRAGVPPHSAFWALGARRGEDTLRVRRRAHIDHYRRTCHMCAQGLGGDWPPLGWPTRANDVSSRPRVSYVRPRAPGHMWGFWELWKSGREVRGPGASCAQSPG